MQRQRLRRHHHRQRRRRRDAGPAPRAVGQADPAPRARRLAAARDRELGRRRGVRQEPVRVRRTPGTTSNGKPFQPGIHYYVGGATKLYGAALYRLRREDFGELTPPRRRLAGLAHHLRRAGAVLHEGRAAVPGPRRARRGPDRAAGQRAVPVPGRHPRAAHPAAVRRPRAGGLSPVPRAVRRCDCSRSDMPEQPVHPLRDLRRLPVASSRPSPTPRSSASARRSSTRTSRWRPTPAHELDDRRRRPSGHGRRGRARRRARRRYRADIVVVSAGPRTRRSCCCASANDRASRTAWPTARTRSAATTCSTTARPCSRSRRSRTRPSSRRRWA